MFLRPSPEYADQQRRQENDEENEEQDFRDFRGAGRNAGKSKDGRDERDDEENNSVSKHGVLLMKAGAPAWALPPRSLAAADTWR
jgi:hypothetical protein